MIRSTVCTLLFALVALVANAQDKDYYDSSFYDCSLGDHQTQWKVTEFKNGMGFNVQPIKQSDCFITFSDDCIEITHFLFFDDDQIGQICEYHFPVKEYKRLSDNSFQVFRNGDDAYFNFIEVVPLPNTKNKYRLMLALLEDGDMINTKIFFCQPVVISTGKTPEEARAGRGKSVGLPIQVRAKK